MYRELKYITPRGDVVDEPCVYRISDGAVIPFDLNNIDYLDYLQWVEEGNTPEPWIDPREVTDGS
jgi:hypothetical protein